MLQVLTLHLLSGTWEETQQIVSSVGEKSKLSRGCCTKAWRRVSQLEKRVKMKAEKRGKGHGWWGPIFTWPTSAPLTHSPGAVLPSPFKAGSPECPRIQTCDIQGHLRERNLLPMGGYGQG